MRSCFHRGAYRCLGHCGESRDGIAPVKGAWAAPESWLARKPGNLSKLCIIRFTANAWNEWLLAASMSLSRLFCHGAPPGIDSCVQVGSSFGIRVGDRYSAELRSPDFVRCLSFSPLGIVQ